MAGRISGEVVNAPNFLPPDDCRLSPDFYAVSPRLRHIQQAAHSRGRSADAVLLATATRFTAMLDYRWVLPAIVGGVGSLNLLGGLVGSSGVGKSTANAIAEELLPFTSEIREVPVGSGEGLSRLFLPPGEGNERTDAHRNALVTADEGEVLGQLMGRQGATLGGELRKAAHGHALGQYNGHKTTTRQVPANTYRLGFIAGFQPTNGGKFIHDKDTGTPQRFVWASSVDAGIPEPGTRPTWPGTLHGWNLASPAAPRTPLGVVDGVRHEVEWNDHEKNTGKATGDTLDAHRDLGRLRLAGLLALMDDRTTITADDWLWGTMWWNTSANLRNYVAGWWEAHGMAEATTKAKRDGELSSVKAEAAADATTETLARRLTKYAQSKAAKGEPFVPRGSWASRDALSLPEAKRRAEERGWVVFDGSRCLPGPNASEVN